MKDAMHRELLNLVLYAFMAGVMFSTCLRGFSEDDAVLGWIGLILGLMGAGLVVLAARGLWKSILLLMELARVS